MKKLVFAVGACVGLVFSGLAEDDGQAAAAGKACPAARAGVASRRKMNPEKFEETMARRVGLTVEEWRKMTPDEQKAKLKELREKNAAEFSKRQAEMVGVSVEEWNKLSNDERRQKMRDSRDARMAQKAGLSLEEFRKQRDEKDAAFVGMEVSEWMKLSDKEKGQKRLAAMRAARAARQSAKAKPDLKGKEAEKPAAATEVK